MSILFGNFYNALPILTFIGILFAIEWSTQPSNQVNLILNLLPYLLAIFFFVVLVFVKADGVQSLSIIQISAIFPFVAFIHGCGLIVNRS